MCCGRCPIHSAPGSKPCDCEHRARWNELEQRGDAPLPRSSHSLTVVGGRAYCFGGENQPRVPIGSDVHVYDLQSGVWSTSETAAGSPSPRVGHTAVAAGLDKIYVFGGRCGIDMGEGVHAVMTHTRSKGTDWLLRHPRSHGFCVTPFLRMLSCY